MANELLEAALGYAAKGFPVFPVNVAKEPLTANGVIDATTSPEQIKSWWAKHPRANIGLNCGAASLMVLDFDPGSSKEACAKVLGGLPETPLRSKTPRGGDHWFYALGAGEIVPPYTASRVKGEPKFSPHVDVRSFNSYVLLPPSRTADGFYEWAGGVGITDTKPAYRSDEMYRLAQTTREKSKERDEWIIDADLPENVASAVAWLKSDAKPAVKGSGGNITAYATAAMMKSYGLSQPAAFEAMWEHWAPRCTPAWYSPESLETVIEHAYSYNTSPPGNMTPAYRVAKAQQLFKPVVVELPSGRESIAGRFRFVDRAGMAHIKPASWLIQDFLPRDAYAMLVGAPGTFKTFLALDLALTICTGFPEDAIWTAVETGSVLYAAGEGRASMANRVAAWEKLHWGGQRAEGFVLADPVPNVAEDWRPFIDGALQLSPDGYKLVVIDTLGRSMAGANENAQEFASKFTQKVEELRQGLGCTVLALHHAGHEQKGRPRGSMVFIGDVDTLAHVERLDKEMAVAVSLSKQKDAEEWQRPKHIELREVRLSDEPPVKSLAAVPGKPPALPQRPSAKPGQPKQNDGAVALVLDAAVKAVLASNKLHAWTTKKLAAAVAMQESVEVDSKTLAATALVRLRETGGTYASRAYDPATERWRHQEPN